jgi:NAD-dependent deacetylase
MIQDIDRLVKEWVGSNRLLTFLTGAGISAESGIPTFRGPEGYWTVGSKNYHPQEMATFHMFTQYPDEVWTWYLYRMGVCQNATPNQGHLALAALEEIIEDRFLLITQNVDNLHIRAGNSLLRTYQIHGNVFSMRCAQNCTGEVYPLPDDIKAKQKGDVLEESDRMLLKCPNCGALTRPHVLWFDETYNDAYFYFSRSLRSASRTGLLIIVGTAGATNLPNQIAWSVFQHGGKIIDINIEENPFSKLARKSGGMFIKAASSQVLPDLLAAFREAVDTP